MDLAEATMVLFKRIEELDPQNVGKVVGHVLLQNQGVLEMIRLANAPSRVLQSLIAEVGGKLGSNHTNKGKNPLVVSNLPTKLTPFESSSSGMPHNQSDVLINGPFHPAQAANLIPYELGKQVCVAFSQGYCKNGGTCKFLHLYRMENGRILILNPPNRDGTMIPGHSSLQQGGSLKHLEMELVELLRCRGGIPVSISSIPILYYDKYATSFPLEHRNKGELVRRMKQVLAQMEKTILLVNRPHGRESIVLAEDFKNHKKPNDGGHGLELRVYMTFRPQCIFTEEDVRNYFENFGAVQEVKIPYQEKRMFGFVTFDYPETAALVLTKNNPHYILGSQVMVKPYRLR